MTQDPALLAYAAAHTTPESPLLARINRDTHAQVLQPRMLSGHAQGRFLAAISRMIRPQRILEIGTFTGYSAICLAEGLADGGTLTTIEVNEELEDRVRGYLAEAGLTHRVDFCIGDALTIVPQLAGPFDLVFIDAGKASNAAHYANAFDKVTPGGFILVDNVLWDSKVTTPYEQADKDTRLILDFNHQVRHDPRAEVLLLPLRDGLLLIRKK